MELAAGAQIGKYELGRKLGEGGFGVVFVARDTGLDRDVAIKLLRPEHTQNAQILQRFVQEARSAAKIVHPGIVTVFECGVVAGTGAPLDGAAFIAMELLHGESVATRLERCGRLDAGAAIEIARQIASALEAAHGANIVHRDLKPDNVYLVRDPAVPGGERVKVLDFGIAKLSQVQSTASGVHTASMMVFGTPRYMSPEQCKSAAHADHRSDIYALGCILLELVTGQPPFDGEFGELIAKHQLAPAPSARSRVPDVPPSVDAMIARLLAKAPGDRPQTMAAVQEAIVACGLGTVIVPGTTATMMAARPSASHLALGAATTLSTANGAATTPPKPSSRRWGLVVGVVGALGVVAAIGVVVATRGGDGERVATSPGPAAQPAPAPPSPAVPAVPAIVPADASTTVPAVIAAAPSPSASAGSASAASGSAAPRSAAPRPASTPARTPVTPEPPRLGFVDAIGLPGAQVLIDGVTSGVSPLHHVAMSPGVHAISYAVAGGRPIVVQVVVRGGQTVAAIPAQPAIEAGSADKPADKPAAVPCAPAKDGFVDPFHKACTR